MNQKTNSKLGTKEILAKGLRLLKKPSPEQVLWLNFAVTYLCNGRCAMCNIWRKYKDNPGLLTQELTLEEIKSFLSSRYLRNLQGISFTGGEPFLRDDFVELVGLFVQRYPDAFISIATNGLSPKLTVRKTKEIIAKYKPKFISLSLSLDGIGKKHAEMRGVSQAYRKVMGTVDLLQDGADINLGFDFTITPQNYKELLKVFELSQELGVKFLAGFAHNSQSFYENPEISFTWKEDELTELRSLMDQIAKGRTKQEPLLSKLVDPYAYFLSNSVNYEIDKKRMFHCYSGTHSLFLDPQGNVYPCILLDEKMGNIKEKAFDKFWISAPANRLRAEIDSNKCRCWAACEVVPSVLRGLKYVRWNILHKFLVSRT